MSILKRIEFDLAYNNYFREGALTSTIPRKVVEVNVDDLKLLLAVVEAAKGWYTEDTSDRIQREVLLSAVQALEEEV